MSDTIRPNPRGEATRRRLLDAAAAEFAQHGMAGARVDRIADAARSNKAQLYAYFRSKEGLFDAVFAEHVDRIVEAVPLEDDLPAYAVRLYDSYLASPEVVRLVTWARLERHPVGDLFHDGIDHDAHKVEKIREAQARGTVDPRLDAADLLAVVIAMSMAWSPASATTAAYPGEAPAVHERRRRTLAAMVDKAVRP